MNAQILTIETIVSDPNIRAGRPIIVGTGIRVSDVAALSIFHSRTPDQIDAEIREDDEAIQRAKEQAYNR